MPAHVEIGFSSAYADEVVRYVAGSIFSVEWEDYYSAPSVFDPYVIDDRRSHYNVRAADGDPVWINMEREQLMDDGAYIGEAPLYFQEWFGPSGQPELAWRSYGSVPGSHYPSPGETNLYRPGHTEPIFTGLPADVLGAARLNGIALVATSLGFYYRDTDAAAWVSIGGQSLIDHVAYYPRQSGTPSGWGLVRFSASGTKAVCYAYCSNPNRTLSSEDDFSMHRFDASFTESDGVVALAGSSTSVREFTDVDVIYENFVHESTLYEGGLDTPGIASSTAVLGDAGPVLVAVDFDGDDLVELYVDWELISGSFYIYYQKYDAESQYNPTLHVESQFSIKTKVEIKKAGATLFEVDCGTTNARHKIDPPHTLVGGKEQWVETLDFSVEDFRHIVWWDMRSQTVLGVKFGYDESGSGVWEEGYGSRGATITRTLSAPALYVVNSDGEFAEPISTETSQEISEVGGWSAGSFASTLSHPTDTLRTLPWWIYAVDTNYHMPGLPPGPVKVEFTPTIAGASSGVTFALARGCASKNGDVLFEIHGDVKNYEESSSSKRFIAVHGLFHRATGKFTKLSEVYADDDSPPEFQWAWNSYQWWDDHRWDLIYATRMMNERNSQSTA